MRKKQPASSGHYKMPQIKIQTRLGAYFRQNEFQFPLPHNTNDAHMAAAIRGKMGQKIGATTHCKHLEHQLSAHTTLIFETCIKDLKIYWSREIRRRQFLIKCWFIWLWDLSYLILILWGIILYKHSLNVFKLDKDLKVIKVPFGSISNLLLPLVILVKISMLS